MNSIFGVELPNGQLIADAFASKVPVAVYMPDYLFDDPVPRTNLTLPAEEKKKRLGEWLSRHGQDVTAPAVDEVIKGLREKGVTEFAAIGYCFGALARSFRPARGIRLILFALRTLSSFPGARCVVDLCISSPPVLSAGAVAHPSLLDVPDDLHALNASTVEFLWLHMLQDFVFTRDKQELAKEITKNNPKHVHAGAVHVLYRPACLPLTSSPRQTSTAVTARRTGATRTTRRSARRPTTRLTRPSPG